MAQAPKTMNITGRARPFSDEEAKLFNHAASLLKAHGRQEAMFVAGRSVGQLAHADVGPFRIELSHVADGWEKTVEIGVAHEGKPVFRASFEQWRRPKRKRELSIRCDVPTFERGAWEQALLALPVPERRD